MTSENSPIQAHVAVQKRCDPTNALQQSDLLAKVAQAGHQDPVVHRNERNDADGVEQGQGGCWYAQFAAKHLPVHLGTLLHKEAAHLQNSTPMGQAG